MRALRFETFGDPSMLGLAEVAVVCFMAPATFLTSLGLIDAAITRTRAIVLSVTGVLAAHPWPGLRRRD